MYFPTIYTPRCLIRPLQLEDAPLMHEGLKLSFKTLKNWMPWAAKGLASLDDTKYFIQECMDIWAKDLKDGRECTLIIMDRQNTQFIGSIGLTALKLAIPSFEIGYWINQHFSGQGLITEAINGLVRYLFSVYLAKRFEIYCEVNNTKSAAVAQRLNFRLEGRLVNARLKADGRSITDVFLYAMTNSNDLPKIEVTWN